MAKEIGAIARPKTIIFTPDLPKTRSGKIMRRLLRDVAEGRELGDTTTLADAGSGRGDPHAGGHRARRGLTGVGRSGRAARELGLARRPRRARTGRGVRSRWRALRRRGPPAFPRRAAGVRTGSRSSTTSASDPLVEDVNRLLELLDERLAIVLLSARPGPGARRNAGVARALRHPLGPARDATRRSAGLCASTSNARSSNSSSKWGSIYASRSRTTAATSRCSAPQASRACTSTRATTSKSIALVAEVLELQGDAEVAALQRRDDRLQVVALLAGDPQLVALGLGLDALEPEVLDELVELAALSDEMPAADARRLADGALRGLLDLAVVEALQRDLRLTSFSSSTWRSAREPVLARRCGA